MPQPEAKARHPSGCRQCDCAEGILSPKCFLIYSELFNIMPAMRLELIPRQMKARRSRVFPTNAARRSTRKCRSLKLRHGILCQQSWPRMPTVRLRGGDLKSPVSFIMPAMRLELIPVFAEGILSPQCLPFHHAGFDNEYYHKPVEMKRWI